MVDTQRELVDLSDEVWQRIRTRVDGLSDDEYFWEPAPGCWSIRQRVDGTWRADWPLPRPEPEPFTTIAWRLWHLIDMYGEDRAPRWLDVPTQGAPIGLDGPDGAPPNAADAIARLEQAHARWDLVVGLVQRGASVSTTGRTALHLAAGAGELEVVKTLLDHGADPGARDPEFHATPRQWAEFLRHLPVADYLVERATTADEGS